MEYLVVLLAGVAAFIYAGLQKRLGALEEQLRQQNREQNRQAVELEQLRLQLARRPQRPNLRRRR